MIQGTVKKVEWINPHSWITIDVKTANGAVETWEIEAGAPNAMFRRGFNKDSLPIGTEIVVTGYLAKNGLHRINGRDLTFPDGRKLFMPTSNPFREESPKRRISKARVAAAGRHVREMTSLLLSVCLVSPAIGSRLLFKPVATISQIMSAITLPYSDALVYIQRNPPQNRSRLGDAGSAGADACRIRKPDNDERAAPKIRASG